MDKRYDTLSDNEIIALIKSKDDDAMDYMMQKYGNLVKKEIRTVYLIGGDTDDLIQEGMIGLFKAIRDYESDKGAVFSTFATLCIRRQIQNAIKNSNRKKHSPLNTYISIYDAQELGDKYILEDMQSAEDVVNPEDMIIEKEQKNVIAGLIKTKLSPYEKKVLILYFDGLSYSEIGDRLGKTAKSVNNALQRIRNKISLTQ
ncbi:MAG: sigma-70 family RNA polymerase sigma factor [Wujia sp.]